MHVPLAPRTCPPGTWPGAGGWGGNPSILRLLFLLRAASPNFRGCFVRIKRSIGNHWRRNKKASRVEKKVFHRETGRGVAQLKILCVKL
jgi:hypothetical protein